ncbi:hypothetical protein [Maridesulfovibrio zosterae]|uniref:hypothetical protein n=1 Tax=Maridesulfovibrio zosterae TaxID=82171 RepID=UPI0003FA5B4A|nr:hypothetical protein [Maridesulfovibrio zosterae]
MFIDVYKFKLMFLVAISMLLGGCAGMNVSADHESSMKETFGEEYYIPRRPTDHTNIGFWYSPSRGLQPDRGSTDNIELRVDRSHDGVQKDFAYSLGTGIQGQSLAGPAGEAGIEVGNKELADIEGLEIIKPVNIGDIPFKPAVAYVTEALRLKYYDLDGESRFRTEVGAKAAGGLGVGSGNVAGGINGHTGTSGRGLVVAYKLEMLDEITADSSGIMKLPLNKSIFYDKGALIADVKYELIEPGSGKYLPEDIWWICDEAEAVSSSVVAAWVVRITSMESNAVDYSIGIPAYPSVHGCKNFSTVLDSYIDPATDKVIRSRVNLTILDAETDDSLKPKKWDARIKFTKETFTTKVVAPEELSKKAKK